MTVTNDYDLETLLPLLARQSQKYTSGDSSSIPYDLARQLMRSILYNIDALKNSSAAFPTQHLSAEKAFEIGLSLRKQQISHAKKLYEEISTSFCSYHNQCYEDTIIKGMPAFFERYDVEFDAENHLLTLDYPLLTHIAPNKSGIDLIEDYLQKTKLEQDFLHTFAKKSVVELLENYHRGYYEDIFNICRLVLTNALACQMLHISTESLTLRDQNIKSLEPIFDKKTDILNVILYHSLIRLAEEKHLEDAFVSYLKSSLPEIAHMGQKLVKTHQLNQIFIIKQIKKGTPKTIYQDGKPMPDEDLRELIKKMSDVLSTSDKIAMLKKSVHSLADLKEILAECFFKNEFNQIFSLLTPVEIHFLAQEIHAKKDDHKPLLDWENALLLYEKIN